MEILSCDGPHFPTGFDFFRVEWERAGWRCAGLPERGAEAKLRLVKWRLGSLLAGVRGDGAPGYGGGRAGPELSGARGQRGADTAKAGRGGESVWRVCATL